VLNFVWGGVLHTISHCFSLEKKTPSEWIRLIFPVGSPKKRKKKRGVDGHDREVERV
jgi:hypothetical protein